MHGDLPTGVQFDFKNSSSFPSKSFGSNFTPSDLFFDNHCLSSSQGVRQGDPLGPFLYSLTTLPVLSWLNSLSGVSCVAYLDDTYIVIDSDVDSSDLLNQLSQK
ncbi:hypothetical protein GEMRC1_013173 [Eukaryota sp. GEM-RC1]